MQTQLSKTSPLTIIFEVIVLTRQIDMLHFSFLLGCEIEMMPNFSHEILTPMVSKNIHAGNNDVSVLLKGQHP